MEPRLQALEDVGTIQSRGQGQRMLGFGQTLSPRAHRIAQGIGLARCGRWRLQIPGPCCKNII